MAKKTIDVTRLTLGFIFLLVVMFIWDKAHANEYYNQFAEVECLCSRQPNVNENGEFISHYSIDKFDINAIPTFEEEFNSIIHDYFVKKDQKKNKGNNKRKARNNQSVNLNYNIEDEISFQNSDEDEIDTIVYHQKKAAFHRCESNRTYNNIIQICKEVRDIDQQRVIDTCFKVAAATCTGIILKANITTAFITSLVGAFFDYGLNNYNIYPYLRSQSRWCEYHTELAEFHEGILLCYNLR